MAKFRSNKYEIVRVSIQNDIGRVALGATRIVATESVRGEVEWSSFEKRVMKSNMIYMKRIKNMDDKRIVKKIYNFYSGNSKWQKSSSQYVKLCRYRKMDAISLDGNI